MGKYIPVELLRSLLRISSVRKMDDCLLIEAHILAEMRLRLTEPHPACLVRLSFLLHIGWRQVLASSEINKYCY